MGVMETRDGDDIKLPRKVHTLLVSGTGHCFTTRGWFLWFPCLLDGT